MTAALHPQVSVNALAFEFTEFERPLGFAVAECAPLALSRGALEAAGWDAAVARLAASPVQISYLMHSAPFSLEQPGRWDDERRLLRRTVVASARLGSNLVCVISGAGGALTWEQTADRFTEAMVPVSDAATADGVRIVLEPGGQLRQDLSFAYTLRDVVALARGAGVGVCVDTYFIDGRTGAIR